MKCRVFFFLFFCSVSYLFECRKGALLAWEQWSVNMRLLQSPHGLKKLLFSENPRWKRLLLVTYQILWSILLAPPMLQLFHQSNLCISNHVQGALPEKNLMQTFTTNYFLNHKNLQNPSGWAPFDTKQLSHRPFSPFCSTFSSISIHLWSCLLQTRAKT